jgi:hypothetical protein
MMKNPAVPPAGFFSAYFSKNEIQNMKRKYRSSHPFKTFCQFYGKIRITNNFWRSI